MFFKSVPSKEPNNEDKKMKKIKCVVKFSDELTSQYELDEASRVFKLKEMIQDEHHFPIPQQKLICNGTALQPDLENLSKFTSTNELLVSFFHTWSGDTLNLSVKTLTGRTIPTYGGSDTLIETIKQRIQDREGIPPDSQRLIFAGIQIDSDFTLHDCGISAHATLHLVLRLRGDRDSKSPEQTEFNRLCRLVEWQSTKNRKKKSRKSKRKPNPTFEQLIQATTSGPLIILFQFFDIIELVCSLIFVCKDFHDVIFFMFQQGYFNGKANRIHRSIFFGRPWGYDYDPFQRNSNRQYFRASESLLLKISNALIDHEKTGYNMYNILCRLFEKLFRLKYFKLLGHLVQKKRFFDHDKPRRRLININFRKLVDYNWCGRVGIRQPIVHAVKTIVSTYPGLRLRAKDVRFIVESQRLMKLEELFAADLKHRVEYNSLEEVFRKFGRTENDVQVLANANLLLKLLHKGKYLQQISQNCYTTSE